MQIKQEKGHYTLYKENEAIGMAVVDGATILRLEIVPEWRGRGYGSYLVKELLRRGGGLDPKQATRFTAPLPRDEAGRALARRFDFLPEGGRLVRRRVPDLSAVQLCHEFLEAHLTPGGCFWTRPAATATIRCFCAAWPGRMAACWAWISSPRPWTARTAA